MKLFNQRTYRGFTSELNGQGWIGGSLPPDPNPNSPDGRTRVMGEPVQMIVILRDGKSRAPVMSILSNRDGTWKFSGLKLNHWFAVEFVNQNGVYTDNTGTPYNSFIQDFIYPMSPEFTNIGPFWGHDGENGSVRIATSHRYFRVLITGVYSNSVASASSIILMDRDGVPLNVSSATASSEFPNGNHPATNAFDGANGTWWASSDLEQLPAHISFSGNDIFEPSSLSITSQPDAFWGPIQAFRSFLLQVSNDNVNWQTLMSIENEPEWTPNETRSWSLIDH